MIQIELIQYKYCIPVFKLVVVVLVRVIDVLVGHFGVRSDAQVMDQPIRVSGQHVSQ